MKIAVVTYAPYFRRDQIVSGNAVRAHYFVEALREEGAQVAYLYPRRLAPEGSDSEYGPEGVEVQSYESAEDLMGRLEAIAPDAVLVGYWEILEKFPDEYPIPIIVDVLAPRLLEAQFQAGRSIGDEMDRMVALYRRADRFLVGSEHQRSLLLSWLLLAGFDCRYDVPIDVVPIAAEPGSPRRHDPDSDQWCLVGGGVAWPWRRDDVYLHAVGEALASEEGMAGVLRVVTGGYVHGATGENDVDRYAAVAALPSVERLPLLPYGEMEELFRDCDIGLELCEDNVERRYSFSFRGIEYLRCGLPVICNATLELARHVREFDAGWTVDKPEELPDLLASIAAAPADYARKSENAIRLVKERFHYSETFAPVMRYLAHPTIPERNLVRLEELKMSRHVGDLQDQMRRSEQALKGMENRLTQRIDNVMQQVNDHIAARIDQAIETFQAHADKVFEQEISRAEQQYQYAREDARQAAERASEAERRIEALVSSHSWRLTAPLRAVSGGLRALVRPFLGARGGNEPPARRRAGQGAPKRVGRYRRGWRLFREAWARPSPGRGDGPAAVRGRKGGRYVAIVTRKDIFPVNHGAAVKIERTAWGLSHFVDGVVLVTGDWGRYYIFEDGQMREGYYPRWVRLAAVFALRGLRKLRRLGVPDGEAYLFNARYDWGYRIRLAYLRRRFPFSLYQADFPAYAYPCLWAKRLFGGETLLAQHNVEYERLRDQYDIPDKAYQWLKRQEVEACNRVDEVVVVSESDRSILEGDGVDPDKLHLIPHGVDLEAFDRSEPLDLRDKFGLPPEATLLVYHGIYSYYPNLEAVEVLAREILPLLQERGLCIKVLAIGPAPPREAVHPDVTFTGSVDQLAPYLKGADLAVVPLQSGGGTRMKILEYFAAELPVVATAKGIEGIPIEPGKHAIVEDESAAIADAVARLIRDPERSRSLASEGRRFVESLDWKNIAREYARLTNAISEVGDETPKVIRN